MSWRGIYFSRPARLSLKRRALHIERNNEPDLDFALEDVNYIVLESPQITVSSALLAACAVQGCLVLSCDEKHLPQGMLLPYHTYYQQLATVQLQLNLSAPRQKRLWQEIIKTKIRNQASCLRFLGRSAKCVQSLAALEMKVKSGDADNTEALAARMYWSHYAQDFIRNAKGESRLNALLNYGYALIRAAISRELAASGFIPALGVHHKNKANAFNLSDDLIEPWRPFLDAFAMHYWLKDETKESLDTQDKQTLCEILHSRILMPDGEYDFMPAINFYIKSIRLYYEGARGKILFPDFPPC